MRNIIWRKRQLGGRPVSAVLGLCAALVVGSASQAAGVSVDLRSAAGPAFVGAHDVSAAGDVNGDGLADLLVAEGSLADTGDQMPGGSRPTEGRVYVVFGSVRTTTSDLDDSRWAGFVVEGADRGDHASEAAGLGDVNGDGLDDIVIGAEGADNNNRSSSGSAYVVFGKKDHEPIDLVDLDLPLEDPRGFRIDGPWDRALAGSDVAGLADQNGDGLAEIMIGAPFAGSTYIVYGKSSTEPVDLLLFELDLHEEQGFVIDTPAPDSSAGYSVASAGDVNADGIGDLAIGVVRTVKGRGRAFVVFGSSSSDRVDVRDLRSRGFTIRGVRGDGLGRSVAGIGDANGDGYSDLAVGSPAYDLVRGRDYVIFGAASTRTVEVENLGRRGFAIQAKWVHDQAGGTVAAAGDANHDGLADVILGADRSNNRNRTLSGSAYVVYGKRGSKIVRLRYLRGRGFRIDGAEGARSECGREFCLGDLAGSSVAGLGDFDGDGNDDLAVGAILGGRWDQGKAYVVRGR